MKYKIIKTDLQINNKLHPENSEVELTKEQIKGIEDYLIPINNSGLSRRNVVKPDHPELVSGSLAKKNKSKGAKK